MATTQYKVKWNGENNEGIGCLSGHGIIQVDPIDATTAIVTVEGNGALFEQHAAFTPEIEDFRELCTFWGTDTETYYLDAEGHSWNVNNSDGIPTPRKAAIPEDAVRLSDSVLDDCYWQVAREIEGEEE